jgi:hypothetical protein
MVSDDEKATRDTRLRALGATRDPFPLTPNPLPWGEGATASACGHVGRPGILQELEK